MRALIVQLLAEMLHVICLSSVWQSGQTVVFDIGLTEESEWIAHNNDGCAGGCRRLCGTDTRKLSVVVTLDPRVTRAFRLGCGAAGCIYDWKRRNNGMNPARRSKGLCLIWKTRWASDKAPPASARQRINNNETNWRRKGSHF